jgi:uncharacterized protein DUF4198
MKLLVRSTLAVLLSLVVGGQVSAHHLWLERDGDAVQLYFGEFGENLREVSPGLLDKLEPKARTASSSGEQALTVTRTPKAFALSGALAAGEGVIAEDPRYPIHVGTRDGVTRRSMYWPAARLVAGRAPVQPTLTLDVVPAGGDKFRVFFRGKPVAKAKVEVMAAFGWSKEARTDEEGTISIALPWRGLYALEVHHSDTVAGKRGEEAYDVANYVTTLTLVQVDGLAMPPMPPPAKPN